MNEDIRICGLYMRVSTEEQAREGFSLAEQRERLEMFCKFKGYQIYDYYEDRGISAKTGNERPEFDRMLEDGKQGKLNAILSLKLDRISRSVYDWENLMKYSEKNDVAIICVNDDINTTTANGKMITRIMMSVSQNEIERTSERTVVGLVGAIKEGHIPGRTPIGYNRVDKLLVINPITSEIVKKIFKLYELGNSHYIIAETLNKDNINGKHNFTDSSIRRILENPVYKGDYVCNRGTKREQWYFGVCPPIIDRDLWDWCQLQGEKNSRNYIRMEDYLFLQKLKCPVCGRILGGKATKKKNGNKYFYYRCLDCKNNIAEKPIEMSVADLLNDVVEYDGIVNNYFKPLLRNKINVKTNYEAELTDLRNKEERIRRDYISGSFDLDIYNQEIEVIQKNIKEIERQQLENQQLDKRTFSEDDILVQRDLDYINRIKRPYLFEYKYRVWSKLSRLEKQEIVLKYIDNIELKQVGKYILANKINFRNTYQDRFMNELFEKGLIDKALYPHSENGPYLRFSNYLEESKTLENINKLREVYQVNLFEGKFNNDTKMLNFKMPTNYDVVRVFPTEQTTNINEVEMGILAVRKDELKELDFEIEFAEEIMIDCLLEVSGSSIKNVRTIDDTGVFSYDDD